ncbi:MAG: hypothetical protein OEZ19_04495, partial [Paracoccaceae bacterium]|nr:hypothetical protein [Paracoccaceae bacterium]
MISSGHHQNQFKDRIQRINSGPGAQVFVGPAKDATPQNAAKSKKKVRTAEEAGVADWAGNILLPFGLVWSFFLGIFVVMMARFLRFLVTGGTIYGIEMDLVLLVDASVAIALGIGLRSAIPKRRILPTLFRTAGTAAALVMMHNPVHVFPDIFGAIFSPMWVQEVLQNTLPWSIHLLGH